MVAGLMIPGVILSVLIRVAFSPRPFTEEQSRTTVDLTIEQVCSTTSLNNYIKCEVIQGATQGGSFNVQALRTKFDWWSGIIFATAKPRVSEASSSLETPSGPSGDDGPSKIKLIWKVTGAVRGLKRTPKEDFPVRNKIRVVMKFHFKENDKLRKKEEENLQTLNTFGLAPARYVFENEAGLIMSDFITMERIDGVTLLEYIELAERMREFKGCDARTNLRLPGLRLLYIHLETLLLLKRLQMKYKWRHCNLHGENVMIRKSTKEGVYQLAQQLRNDEPDHGQMTEAHRKAWISLQLKARSIVIQEDDDEAYYQTDNKHMVFINTEFAEPVDTLLENSLTYYVCPTFSDISRIFMYWKKEKVEINRNAHLTRMRQALKKIFAPLAYYKLIASKEERVLLTVIEGLKELEEKEKKNFIAHLKVSNEKTKVDPPLRTVQRRHAKSQPQFGASGQVTRIDSLLQDLKGGQTKAHSFPRRTQFTRTSAPRFSGVSSHVLGITKFPALRRGMRRESAA